MQQQRRNGRFIPGACVAVALVGIVSERAFALNEQPLWGGQIELPRLVAFLGSLALGFASAALVAVVTSLGDRLHVFRMLSCLPRRNAPRAQKNVLQVVSGHSNTPRESPQQKTDVLNGPTTQQPNEHGEPLRMAVVTYYFNPTRNDEIRSSYRRIVHELTTLGLAVFTAEIAFPGEVFPTDNAFVKISADESNAFWQKERIINLVVAKLPESFKVVAWIDPGVQLLHQAWMTHALEIVRHTPVAQLFQHALVVNEEGQVNSVVPTSQRRRRAFTSRAQRVASENEWNEGAWVAKREVFPLYEGCAGVGGAACITSCWRGHVHHLHERGDELASQNCYADWAREAHRKVDGRIGVVPGQAIVRANTTPLAIQPGKTSSSTNSATPFTTVRLVEHANGLLSVQPGASSEAVSELRRLCGVEIVDKSRLLIRNRLPDEFLTSKMGADA